MFALLSLISRMCLGWTYICHLNLEAYRLPYPEFVRMLRNSLRHIYAKGMQLEQAWSNIAVGVIKAEEAKNRRETCLSPWDIEIGHIPDVTPSAELHMNETKRKKAVYSLFAKPSSSEDETDDGLTEMDSEFSWKVR